MQSFLPPRSLPLPSLSPSFHPSILPRLRHPHVYHSHHVPESAQRPGLDVWTCLRTEHYSAAELHAGSRPRHPASGGERGHCDWSHGLFGVCISVVLCLIFLGSSQPTHRVSDCGLLGTDNISIKSLYILQQRRSRSSLPRSSRSSAVICC